MDSNELYHHGILGMKWGIRRYQNKDGSLTAAGKKRQRQDSPEAAAKRKAIAKKVAAATIMTATVAAAAVIYKKNPEAAKRVLSRVGKTTVSALKTGKNKAVKAGKAYVKTSIAGVKEGIKEGAKEAPKKATKAIITGITLNAAKRGLDYAVGKSEAERIMKANNSKKIDSFWKVREEDDE